MKYNVRADRIAQDIEINLKDGILEFLETYDFQYITSVKDKSPLRNIFKEHFIKRHSIEWFKDQMYALGRKEGGNLKGVTAVAYSETNRLHTMILGELLLSKGIKKCVTVHSYENTPMSRVCQNNLEGKELDIQEVINNSFPNKYGDLMRTDVPMIPQHVTCRHVMAPI